MNHKMYQMSKFHGCPLMHYRVKENICNRIGRKYGMSLEEMIAELNPVIRGWNN